ncbi:MAG: DUF1269 domain-containing protein [Desulfobacteraceae bacterium]|nr:DUF1269 domain-containing protein [Desulfobacteraceae bacterium]
MSDLIISVYGDVAEAESVRRHLVNVNDRSSLGLEEAVIMEKNPQREISFRHTPRSSIWGAVSGAFIGLLFGVLILNPVFALVGLFIGLIVGGVAGSIPVGIDLDLANSQAESMQPNSSALYVMSSEPRKVVDEIGWFTARALETKVCTHQEDAWQCEAWVASKYHPGAGILPGNA